MFKKQYLVNNAAILLIFAVWFGVAFLVHTLKGVEFPSPISTLKELAENLAGKDIYDYSIGQHTYTSLLRWLAAYVLAIITGIGTGFLLGLYPRVYRLVMPLIYTLQLIPGLAWIPISLLLFGLGNASTMFMIFMLGYTPIVLTTAAGIKDTPKELIQSAHLMGASQKDLFIHVLFPSSLLQIINGMRIALANSWRVLIAAEMIVGNGIGLGYIIIQSRWTLDYTSAFVSIFIIVLIGLTAEKYIFNTIERRIRHKYGYTHH